MPLQLEVEAYSLVAGVMQSTCVKCGTSGTPVTVYLLRPPECQLCILPEQHLHWTCTRCGHRWATIANP